MRPLARRLVAALVVASGALAAAPARAADVVTVRLQAGRTYEGTIAAAGDDHLFYLDDLAPQPFTVSLKSAGDKTLEPDITLHDSVDTDLTGTLTPFRKDGPTSVAVKKAPFASGAERYKLRVTGKGTTTGAYKLKVTTKVTRSFKGTGAVPGVADSDIFTFFAPTDALVALKVSPTSPGELIPKFASLAPPGCATADLAPGKRVGQASFVAPRSGDHDVTMTGEGATQGAFKWSAKVKPPKPPKTSVRVTGGAASYPAPGPLPAKAVLEPGQQVFGFETDGVHLVRRDVRVSGGGPNVGKNSVVRTTVKGSSALNLANNYATDASPVVAALGLGPTAAAAVSNGVLYGIPRDGSGEFSLEAAAGPVSRVLVDRDSAYMVRGDQIHSYRLDESADAGLPVAAGTIHDAFLGGAGVIYLLENGGNLEVREITTAGTGDALVHDLGTMATVQGMAVRGDDVFVALDDGAGGSEIHRVSACAGLGDAVIFSGEPIAALAADDANVYAIELDPVDETRVVQIPRGGGVAQVLVRDALSGSFTIDPSDLAAAGGYVYFVADVSGTETILRVKRTR